MEAERGAMAVAVDYIHDPSVGSPLLSIADAIKANSYYDPPMDLVTTIGDAKAAMQKAQYTIKGARNAVLEKRCSPNPASETKKRDH